MQEKSRKEEGRMPKIKGFIDTLLGVTIGSEAIKSVGNAGGFPSGLKSATQHLS